MESRPIAEDAAVVRGISWREALPFTHIFRAFHIATHPSKLVLALTALLLLYGGGRIMDSLWQERIFIDFLQHQIAQVDNVVAGVIQCNILGGVETPGVVGAIYRFLIVGPRLLLHAHPVYAIIYAVWFLIVWSIFGGAIARIAAVHVAREEKISFRQALRFSFGKVLSFIFAPVIPLAIVLGLAALLAGSGWILLHIPYLGPIALGLFFFLALLAGVVITLVVLGMAGGFTLMYPTIAVEGSDSFDAISRSFSYVYQRPWKMLFYTALALVYGALTYLFARFFIWLWLLATHKFLSAWLGGQPADYWPAIWPRPWFWSLPYRPGFERLKWSERIAAGSISFWVYLVIALLGAYAISFFFSANTIIYCLLRKDVDATEMDDVYIEEFEDEFSEALPSGAIDPSLSSEPVLPPEDANST